MNLKKGMMTALVAAVLTTACATHTVDEAPASGAQPPDYTVKEAGETVRIEIAGNGYTPKTIGLKKGQAVRLEFFRKDADNCGEEIVIESLGIKKEIPVGIPVVVDITPDKSGEIKFACGMDMLRGKLIVVE